VLSEDHAFTLERHDSRVHLTQNPLPNSENIDFTSDDNNNFFSMFKEPPLLEHLLLESPWLLISMLACLGLTLILITAVKGSRQKAVWGLTFLTLGAGTYLLSAMVVTNREHVAEATKTLLVSTAPFDQISLGTLLDTHITITGPNTESENNFTPNKTHTSDTAWQASKSDVLTRLKTACTTFPLTQNVLKELEVESISDTHARSHFVALSVATNGRARTRWLLDWKKNADGNWVVTRVQWLNEKHPIGISPASALLHRFFDP
jgi:hypothetical protein